MPLSRGDALWAEDRAPTRPHHEAPLVRYRERASVAVNISTDQELTEDPPKRPSQLRSLPETLSCLAMVASQVLNTKSSDCVCRQGCTDCSSVLTALNFGIYPDRSFDLPQLMLCSRTVVSYQVPHTGVRREGAPKQGGLCHGVLGSNYGWMR